MPKGVQTRFVCSECGAEFPNWSGKCRECGSWNTLTEETRAIQKAVSISAKPLAPRAKSLRLNEVEQSDEGVFRRPTGIAEFDRALGGGIVAGSVSLLSGEPGIGKSTLLLQLCRALPDLKILYVSGEESARQIAQRAKRLSVADDQLYLFCETDLEAILEEAKNGYQLILIDSIQTVCDASISSSPGSASQVKQAAGALINLTKQLACATIMVGHVNKDGVIAGPKLLEHMVDVVLYFEGDRTQSCRFIRTIKNRYGATSEIGLFEMTDEGLCEIPDPSRRLLEDTPKDVPGSASVCLMEGTRPILAEIQALVAKSPFPSPKRLANGVDYNRMHLLLAVMEQRLGIPMFDKDVYLNVIGGLRFDETATDLGIVAALYSGVKAIPLAGDTLFLGEIGLSGECRTVGACDARVREGARLGFTRIVLPQRNIKLLKNPPKGVELIGVRSAFELTQILQKG